MNAHPSWSRYRSQRLCARAGCNAPAVATLRFQSTERQAWLAELDESAARTQGDLCQRHAAALVLPRGWELHDERGSAPAAAPAEPEPADEDVGADGNRSRSVPAQFGSNDDGVDDALDAILDARTPLLQRAFRNARGS